jgi:plasmid stabilization system protein ParE
MQIRWTPEAKISYFNILDYLQTKWGTNEIKNFVEKTNFVLHQIDKNPKMFKQSKSKNIRIGLISKQTSLFYRIKKSEIELLTFWDNRQDDKKLKY